MNRMDNLLLLMGTHLFIYLNWPRNSSMSMRAEPSLEKVNSFLGRSPRHGL